MKSFMKPNARRSQEENTPCPFPPPPSDYIHSFGTYIQISSKELEEFKALPATVKRKVSGPSFSLSHLNFDRRLDFLSLPICSIPWGRSNSRSNPLASIPSLPFPSWTLQGQE